MLDLFIWGRSFESIGYRSARIVCVNYRSIKRHHFSWDVPVGPVRSAATPWLMRARTQRCGHGRVANGGSHPLEGSAEERVFQFGLPSLYTITLTHPIFGIITLDVSVSESLQMIKDRKISEIAQQCRQDIMNGFWCDALGDWHFYGYDEDDQKNLDKAANTILLGHAPE